MPTLTPREVLISFIVTLAVTLLLLLALPKEKPQRNSIENYRIDVEQKAKEWMRHHTAEYAVIPESILCLSQYPVEFSEHRLLCKGKIYIIGMTVNFICNLENCRPYYYSSIFQ